MNPVARSTYHLAEKPASQERLCAHFAPRPDLWGLRTPTRAERLLVRRGRRVLLFLLGLLILQEIQGTK